MNNYNQHFEEQEFNARRDELSGLRAIAYGVSGFLIVAAGVAIYTAFRYFW